MNLYVLLGLDKQYHYINQVNRLNKQLTVEVILEVIAKEFGITVQDMKSKSRKAKIIDARRCLVMAMKHFHKNLSDGVIGFAVNYDRTTVYYHSQIHQNIMDFDVNGDYANSYFNVIEKLEPKKQLP